MSEETTQESSVGCSHLLDTTDLQYGHCAYCGISGYMDFSVGKVIWMESKIFRQLRVFCDPVGLHSRAMVRIAEAIKRHKPTSVEIVNHQQDADLVVFYPIGFDWTQRFQECIDADKKYAIVQCCLKTSGGSVQDWSQWWNAAVCVWSYYDLWKEPTNSFMLGGLQQPNFYYAPLGIDPVFLSTVYKDGRSNHLLGQTQRRAIVTTGYVSHPVAEAIEEVWIAARLAHLNVYHIGPFPEGMSKPADDPVWRHVKVVGPNSSDDCVAWHYHLAKYVCALRHTEGFELPAAEGLACGARPILFDQPDIKHWYGAHAEYVPDCRGEDLINHLRVLFNSDKTYRPVESHERTQVKDKFNWKTIVEGFWERILLNLTASETDDLKSRSAAVSQ